MSPPAPVLSGEDKHGPSAASSCPFECLWVCENTVTHCYTHVSGGWRRPADQLCTWRMRNNHPGTSAASKHLQCALVRFSQAVQRWCDVRTFTRIEKLQLCSIFCSVLKHRLRLINKISQACTKLKESRWTVLKSTRVQIRPRQESSGAVLNLHKSYLFLKYDLVKMKLENWKRRLGPMRGQVTRSAPRQLKDGSEAFSDLGADHEETGL